MPAAQNPPWFFGENLMGGLLVWNDESGPANIDTHWFAPRYSQDEEVPPHYWPVCSLADSLDTTQAYFMPQDKTVRCGACNDAIIKVLRHYRIHKHYVAEYLGMHANKARQRG